MPKTKVIGFKLTATALVYDKEGKVEKSASGEVTVMEVDFDRPLKYYADQFEKEGKLRGG